MRTAPLALSASLILVLVGCTKEPLPGFEEPIPVSVMYEGEALGPRLAQSDGVTILSWMERAESGATLKFARYFDRKWRDVTTVVEDPKMFVNWADIPAITPTGADAYLAHWLSYSADARYSYDVMLSHSADGGATWSAPYRPHDDGTPTEHGFVSLYPVEGGTGLVWLDGRNTPDAGMTLRSAVVGAEGEISAESEVDDQVCDCCQTDVAIAASGPIAVYRDRTNDEIRDITVVRMIDGKWQQGTPLASDGWVIEGCPVNGPSIDAAEDLVVASWFTGAGDRPSVKIAFSKNSGQTFSDPIEVAQKRALGRVGIAILDEERFVVTWLESDHSEGYNVKLRALTLDGQLGSVWTVGKTSEMRTVPQLVRSGDELLFAWTDSIEDVSQVVSVRMKIVGFYD